MTESTSENSDPTLLLSIPWLASKIRAKKLEGPAIMLLEMHKPLVGVAHAATLLSAPLLIALGAGKFMKSLAELLESRENIERLITLLESDGN